VVLHNFLLEASDDEVDESDVVEVPNEQDGSTNEEPINQGTAAGNKKRLEVMASALLFREN